MRDPNARCDNFVEVRGEPSLQGCYAPITLLSKFAGLFGLGLPEPPKVSMTIPMHDPADFSQVPTGRIVLVRTGLVGFASMIRNGNQCNFFAPRIPNVVDVLSKGTFFATYFGNMKILPNVTEGNGRYSRPGHWSEFKTAEERESTADVSQRRIATSRMVSTVNRSRILVASPSGTSSLEESSVEAEPSPLARMLKRWERERAQARLTTKHNANVLHEELGSGSAKRSRTFTGPVEATPTREVLEPADVQVKMIAERLAAMADGNDTDGALGSGNPLEPRDHCAGQSRSKSAPYEIANDLPLSVQGGDFDVEADWKKAEEWLTELATKEAESKEDSSPPSNRLLTNFRIQAPSVAGSDATVAESIAELIMNKHRAATSKYTGLTAMFHRSMAQAQAEAKANTGPASVPAGRRGQDPRVNDGAGVPETPRFSSPTPVVTAYRDGMRTPRRRKNRSNPKEKYDSDELAMVGTRIGHVVEGGQGLLGSRAVSRSD
ncbi:hypothetical protein J1614_005140 [Plenodomus biglobosus]|nr:hypothetical protein J1614_005140 [Plenodomus biglobosus]